MIRVELVKLVRRPRVWASLVLLCALPAVVAVFLATTRVAPPPGAGAAFLSAVLRDGSLYPAAAIALVLPVFLPISVAVIAGDSVAGEASVGMLRYLLARPVGRTRLLAAKLVSVAAFVVVAVVLVALTSYLVGILLFGIGDPSAVGQPGGVTSLSGISLSPIQLVLRLLGAIGYVVVSMLGVGAIALFLSTLTDSGLGATLGTLAALVTSEVLVGLDAAASVKPYLPTDHWLAWIDFFREPIFSRDIEQGLGLQVVYVVVLFAASWANFSTKDVTT